MSKIRNSNTINPKLQSLSEDQFKLLQILEKEYTTAYKILNIMPSYTVTVYGGAKLKEESNIYSEIVKICTTLSKEGWGMVSGGGPGAMEAALKGGNIGGAPTTAFKIDLLREQTNSDATNEYLFTSFAPRKHALRQSDVYIFVPGGWGTFDELFELVTLQKVNKIQNKPIILYNKEYWTGILKWLKETVLKEGLITQEELESLIVMDSVEEVTSFLLKR